MAWTSAALINALGESPSSSNLSFNSVYFDWNLSLTECSATVESVNVAYNGLISGRPVSVVAVEDPALQSVLEVDVTYENNATISHSTEGDWSGYGFSLATVYPNLEIYSQWYVPYVNYPSWGCPFDGLNFACYISPWAGLTVESNGGNGIAQAGTDSYVHCTLPFGLGCAHSFDEWYEFFPAGEEICLGQSVSPGDAMESFVAYDAGKYYVLVEDTNNGHSCGSNQAMAMGQPSYAEAIIENPGNPLGGYLPAPYFGQVNVFDTFVGNVANLNSVPHFNYGPGDHVSLPGPLNYPGGYSGSGFNVYQD